MMSWNFISILLFPESLYRTIGTYVIVVELNSTTNATSLYRIYIVEGYYSIHYNTIQCNTSFSANYGPSGYIAHV